MCALSSPTAPEPFSLFKKHFLTLAVTFISLGVERGVIYSSDPDAREPLTPTRGLGGEGRCWQKAHSGDVLEEARNSGWGCSVSWETQMGKQPW